MKTPFHTFAAALILSTALTTSAFAATKVGVAGAVNPEVRAKDVDGVERPLKVGDEIYLNDTITTTGKGAAQLMFLDKSALTISPNATVKIDEFVYNPQTNDGVMTLNSAKGAFRFIGGALTKKKPVKIKTPTSTIGIRGGIADVSNGNAVFIYGEQMSVTDQNGNTLTTSEFGTGFGVGQDGNVQQLPPSVVENMIENSPVDSAAGTGSGGLDSSFDSQLNIGSSGSGGGAGGSSSGGGNSGSASGDSGNTTESSFAGTDGGDANVGGGDTNVDSGDSAQEGVRSSVRAFVESGGDADGDGVLDFDVAGTDLVDPNGGLIDLNPDLIPDGDVTPDNPDDTQNIPPVTDGTDDEGTLPPVVDNGDAEDEGENDIPEVVTTPPPIGSSNSSPVAAPLSFTGNEYAEFPSGSKTITLADLLSGATDADGNALSVNSVTVTSGNAAVSMSGGNYILTPNNDMAPGSSNTISLSYNISDGNGGVTSRTLQYTVTGQDIFGSNQAWSVTSPTLPAAATHTGRTVYRDGANAPENGKIAAYNPVAAPDHFHALLTPDGAPTYQDYVTASLPKSFGSTSVFTGGYATLNAADFFIEEHTGKVNLSNAFSGKAYRTHDSSFYAYYLNWNDALSTDAQHASMVFGTSPLFANFADVNAAESALGLLVSDTGLWASDPARSTASNASQIIEYDFLPEMYATGGDFGYLDYNKAAGFGAAPSGNGLLVDWGNKRFMGGHLNFNGANPRLITTVGKVNALAATSGLALTGGKIDSGNLLEGFLFDSLALEDSVTAGTQAHEIKAFSGNVNAKLTDTFSDTDINNQHVEGLILGGVVLNRDAGGTQNRYIVQPAAISDGGRAIENVNQPADFDTAGDVITHKGFSAGLMTDAGGNVSRIKTVDADDVQISLQRATDGITDTNHVGNSDINYREVDNVGVFSPSATAVAPRTIRFGGTAADGRSAIMERDRYMADVQSTANIGGAQTPKGVIASDKAVGADGLVCSSCQFAHWGVWSASVPNATAANSIQSAIVPYVAGQLYDVAGVPLGGQTGTLTYSGDIAANKITGGGALSNVTGTFQAQIDMDNRAVHAFAGNAGGMQFGFNGNNATNNVNGVNIAPNLHGAVANTDFYTDVNMNGVFDSGIDNFEGYKFNDTTDSFQAPVGKIDGGTFADIQGSINGALFGANAEEVGGNFNVKALAGANAGDMAAGIYLGER